MESLVQQSFDILLNAVRLSGGSVSIDGNAVLSDQELGEVPLDPIHAHESALLRLEPLVQRISGIAVHVDLCKDVPFHFVLDQELLNVDRTSGLLVVKLVARESQDLQTAIFELVVHLVQLLVVCLRQAAVRGHVHDQDRMTLVLLEGDWIVVQIVDREVIYRCRFLPI